MRAALILVSTIALAACGFSAGAQDNDEPRGGPRAERMFDVGSFDAVSLAGPHDVVVTVGPAVSVRAEGPSHELDRLEIEVRGDSLSIGTNRDSWIGSSRGEGVIVRVTVPRLTGASVAGSGDLSIDRVEGDNFSGSVAGSGDLEIAALAVRDARFSIAGSGDIKAAGRADRTSAKIAGSGDVDIGRLESAGTEISVVGSGNVAAHARDTASVSIMGSGDVTIRGGARCSIKKMGSGAINCQA